VSATVTAVVCTYWPGRVQNVQVIVDSLRNGSHQPDHIIVWNNNHPTELEATNDRQWGGVGRWIYGADAIINSPVNYECRAKFIAAMLRHADYYVLCDDDTALGRTTLASWKNAALSMGRERFVTGYWGVSLVANSFMQGIIHQPRLVSGPTAVDAFHGRVMFMGQQALVNTLDLEGAVRDRWPTEGDDLIAGLANPGTSWIIPQRGEELLIDLDDGGEAMQYADGYFAMRDRFCLDVVNAAKERGLR